MNLNGRLERRFDLLVITHIDADHIEGIIRLLLDADADELMQWMRGFEAAPAQTYVVHGDPHASDALRTRVQDELGWRVRVPEQLAQVSL